MDNPQFTVRVTRIDSGELVGVLQWRGLHITMPDGTGRIPVDSRRVPVEPFRESIAPTAALLAELDTLLRPVADGLQMGLRSGTNGAYDWTAD